ncbi:uncharacterized protein TERG_11955 [Trichophyton rubrum CBS 118892]|uniref:AMP-dependent synthetase/ligase domain-containing protein n=1 Tax=Trichophyton rubrum (strain ATCC MYA-4607 / CBS 118892) TaxID=559305 RepID=A0A080WLU6_TRIRC|nr:uncharacterized protein TERG_11955 [Trichophyton rubrum CBS 118892]KFL61100.1 hypothetical protein TERG_11955 [Trichophyton rubrum CBS 118892]
MSKDTVFYPRVLKKGPFTVEAAGYEPVEGETIPRRHPSAKDELLKTPNPEIATTYDNLRWSAKTYGNSKAVGSRRVVKTHVENKKVKRLIEGVEQEVDKEWTYFELSGYSYLTFTEYEQQALQLGAGLRKLGHQTGSRLHLFSSTSAHWLCLSHGAASQSITIVTAYDSLGEEGVRHSLQQTRSESIFLDPTLLPLLRKVLKDAKDVKNVIYDTNSEPKQEHIDALKEDFGHINIMTYEDLRKLGEETPLTRYPHPATTSAVSLAGGDSIVGPYLGPSDVLLTYLPQAHILEFVFENLCLFWGGTMGYGSPKTLSDTSVRNCKGDIRELQPTILVGVPMVWESVKKGIIGNVNKNSAIVKSIFWAGMAAKEFLMSTGLPGAGILDSFVFKKIKDATGGRLRLTLSGGGPVSRETQRFLSMAVCPMINGYGLTETSAMGGLNDPMAWTNDAIGEIPAAVEMKLVDFADAGYFTKNDPPQGEIWIRGVSVANSYFDNDEETKAAFSPDGWFMTGDIGQFEPNGHIKVIDRKKNLVKSLNGEYIALEKLESIYRSAPVVANICVYAAQDQAKPVAIIVPAEPALLQLAKSNGIQGDSIGTLVHDKKLNSIILRDMQNVGKSAGLRGFEIIEGVVLSDEEWTPQNGFVTAAQKLQRKKLVNKYQKDIDRAYGKSS